MALFYRVFLPADQFPLECHSQRGGLIKLRPIVLTLGLLLCAVAAAMACRPPSTRQMAMIMRVFLASAVFTAFIGGLMLLASISNEPFKIGIKKDSC